MTYSCTTLPLPGLVNAYIGESRVCRLVKQFTSEAVLNDG